MTFSNLVQHSDMAPSVLVSRFRADLEVVKDSLWSLPHLVHTF